MSKQHYPVLEPAILVIFGITGDLARRKLLPALYHLVKMDLIHKDTLIVGISRQKISLDDAFKDVELCVNEIDGVCDPKAVKQLRSIFSVHTMDLAHKDDYKRLKELLDQMETKKGMCMNRLFYLSIPPAGVSGVIKHLGEEGLDKGCQHEKGVTRLLAEKPFGYDLQSAKELIDATGKYFTEDQVFRIDHYLAKETVQNILAFRFNNPIFLPVWNSEHIEYIEILAHEKLTIEGRANFYESTGALKDLIQSHLLQIMAIVTMEQPDELTAKKIHANKLDLLKQVKAIKPDDVLKDTVRGQYEGYKSEVSNENSVTETFAALKLEIDSPNWKGVPVIVRTGKALNEKLTEVNVVFKPTKETPHHNVLTFRIQPNEGIELGLRVKKPGLETNMEHADMDFSYTKSFASSQQADAYERVLVDAFKGDPTLFATSNEILESWRIIQHVLEFWSDNTKGMSEYPKKSKGPKTGHLYER